MKFNNIPSHIKSKYSDKPVDKSFYSTLKITKNKISLKTFIKKATIVNLFGGPGTGKTSLARVMAAQSQRHFIELSGVEGSVADLRKAMSVATEQAQMGKRTLLFIDEHGRAKVNIALAKGKKEYDKRQTLREKQDRRDMDRAVKHF